ncbi:MAG: hypothetical protein Q7J57_16855 [Gemmobacter sp.]|nr:hypothetical protein [Gemmobacter sp.]
MRIGPLISLLSSTYGLPEAGVVLVARALREAGWLSTGARGVNAPEMGPRDVARLTLALLSGEPPSKVVDEFEFIRTLQTAEAYPTTGFLPQGALPEGHNLEDMVTALFVAAFDDERVKANSEETLFGSQLWPRFSVSVDASRRVAEVQLPGRNAEYSDLTGAAQLDQLYPIRPMTLEAIEQIRMIESRASSPGSSNVVASRGMRVVRTISEAEFEKIAAAMHGPP